MYRKYFKYLFFSSLLYLSTANAQSYVPQLNDHRLKVQPTVQIKAYAFDLKDVQLLDSRFKMAMKADETYLFKIEPDRLLAGFRSNAGLQQKAKKYAGWESDGLAGHSLGHYLSAISFDYTGTKNAELLKRINYIVDELVATQQARKTGYIGAIPNEDKMWSEVAAGNIRSGGFDLNGGWAPWYTVHKIMAGLLDAYLYVGNRKALLACQGMANWTGQTIGGLNDEQLQKMLFCEYGGMAETLTNLYAITGTKKYLELSYKFYDKRILDPLAERKDILPGKHSNTQIPKIIASARRHELTGNKKDLKIAEFFWETVTGQHSYVTGGNSNYEYLSEPGKLNDRLSENTTETCNTYNMLKLTSHLFALRPSAALFDYYERALYNHILASQNHETGMMCYFVPLRMGGKKHYSSEFHDFTCCVGTGMENHVKYNESIYFRDKERLYVNLFISSVLHWKDKGVKISQSSAIPNSDHTILTIQTSKGCDFSLLLRKPHWAEKVVIRVNGIVQNVAPNADGYISIKRIWKNNDKIIYELPQRLYTEAMPDNADRKAVFYGPVLLAGVLGEAEPDPVKGLPVFVTSDPNPKHWINRSDSGKLAFEASAAGKLGKVSLIPFYDTENQYYSVYWDVFTPEKWKIQEAAYASQKIQEKEIELKTVDFIRLGEMQPERDHSFSGEKISMGEDHGKKWRMAGEGGFMQFSLKADPGLSNVLIVTYWGMDNRGRIFDILVDGQTVATEDLNKYKESRFYDARYAIPLELTRGKQVVIVKFVPKEKNNAGPVYLIRAVKE